jgi:hypothetical protein
MSKSRSLAEILQHPQTDDEEHTANAYIRRECLRIQQTWSDREREKGVVQPADKWTAPLCRGDYGEW